MWETIKIYREIYIDIYVKNIKIGKDRQNTPTILEEQKHSKQ